MCEIVEKYANEVANEVAKEAAKETAKEIAKNLLRDGMSAEKVSEVTNLPFDQVLTLASEE